MDLYYDLGLNRLVRSLNDRGEVLTLVFRLDQTSDLRLRFIRDNAVVALAEPAIGKFGLKEPGKYDDDFVVAQLPGVPEGTPASGWTKVAEGDDVYYKFAPQFTTDELYELIGRDGTSGNDKVSVQLMGDIKWSEAGADARTAVFTARVTNIVIRDDEGLPPDPNPVWGDPIEYLKKAGNLAGLADVAAARENLGLASWIASWWANIKTLAQTFAGNLTMNGTSNTMPNQTLATGAHVVTRDLGRKDKMRSIAYDYPMEFGAANFAASANASTALEGGCLQLNLTSSALATNYAIANLGYNFISNQLSGGALFWGQPFTIYVCLAGVVRSNQEVRLLTGVGFSSASLSGKGIGVVMVDDTNAKLVVHNGTTLYESATFAVGSYLSFRNFWLVNRGDGNVDVYFAASGPSAVEMPSAPAATLATGPTGYGAGGTNNIVLQSVASGATGSSSQFNLVHGHIFLTTP